MAKTYIDTVKYVVYADAEIDGIIEKPDVVGALFGQTEGLLGSELDLRELQKSGRIGRIEVDLRSQSGKSVGQIVVPSSLDMIETAIIGAALETVDRIGPCEARVRVQRIEDTRSLKRQHVVTRAKEILKKIITTTIPESRELTELVRDEVRTSEVKYYGPEKLPCGPNIEQADHIIVVEGRADVLTMLKCDIENVISLMGKNIPKSVIELSKQKTVTAFVDGDRGGDLIVRQFAELGELDFVSKAPDGKEVEELTQKEVIKSLRRKIPVEQFLAKTFPEMERRERPYAAERAERAERLERAEKQEQQEFAPAEPRPITQPVPLPRLAPRPRPIAPVAETKTTSPPPFHKILKELSGTLKGALLDDKFNVLVETDVRQLATQLEKTENVNAVVFDGIITQRLVDLAKTKNIKYLAGIKSTTLDNTTPVEIITLA